MIQDIDLLVIWDQSTDEIPCNKSGDQIIAFARALLKRAASEPVATVMSVDEYGPILQWTRPWSELVGVKLCAGFVEKSTDTLALEKLKAALRTDNQRARQYLIEEAVELLSPPKPVDSTPT
jgi:hypothetical protein